MLRPGTYRDRHGNLVTVRRTDRGGVIVTHPDRTVTVLPGGKS